MPEQDWFERVLKIIIYSNVVYGWDVNLRPIVIPRYENKKNQFHKYISEKFNRWLVSQEKNEVQKWTDGNKNTRKGAGQFQVET